MIVLTHRGRTVTRYHLLKKTKAQLAGQVLELMRQVPEPKPIATKPFDGAPALVFCPATDGCAGGWRVARWWNHPGGSGWYADGSVAQLLSPTHWVPVPDDPVD